MNYDEYRNEIDMLQGNISRICITPDVDELKRMYAWAYLRLSNIYEYRLGILDPQSDTPIDPSL